MFKLKLLLCLTAILTVEATNNYCKSKINRRVTITATKRPLVKDTRLALVALGEMEAVLLDIMAEHLNFTYLVKPPTDILSAGNLMKNGSWTGATGQLQRSEVEWSLSTAAPTLDKRYITDNSVPVTFVDTSILIPFPEEDGKTVALFDAFQLNTWIGMFVCFTFFIIATWALHKVTNKSADKTQDSLFFWVVYFISVWTAQGLTLRNTSSHFRLTVGVYFLGTYLLSNYYTGAFTSILSVSNYKAPIKSIEELANSKAFKTLLIKGSSTDEYIMTSKDATYKKIADQMIKYPDRRILNALTVDDISKIVRNNYALIIPKSSGESLIQRSYELNDKKCKVTIAEQTFYSRSQTFSFLKDSNLTCTIDFEILLLQQVGLLSYADRKSSQLMRNPCSIQNIKASANSTPVVMTIEHFAGAFLLLAIGCSLSTIIFVLERIAWQIQKKHVVIV